MAVAWPACGLCIIRRLYYIASPTTVTTSQADVRFRFTLGFTTPLLSLLNRNVASYTLTWESQLEFLCWRWVWVSAFVYVIFPSTRPNSVPFVPQNISLLVIGSTSTRTTVAHRPHGTLHLLTFSFTPGLSPSPSSRLPMAVSHHPLFLHFGRSSGVLLALTIRAFMKRRKQFRDLITANSNLTYSRYWRLVALASLDFIFTIPFATWGVVGPALWSEVRPWVSWADTHWGYSRVFQFPRVLLDPVSAYSLETTRWAAVLCAFCFFGFFGFADEARKNYRALASTITKRFGYTTFSESAISDSYVHSFTSFRFRPCLLTYPLYSMVKSSTGSKTGVSLPVFITQQIESKRDSFDSYSDKLSTSIVINDYDLKAQPYSPTEQSTSSSSSSMISPIDEVPRVPESVLDPTSARRPSVPDAPKSVFPDSALDQV